MIGNFNDKTNFSHKLSLTNLQVSRLPEVIADDSSAIIKKKSYYETTLGATGALKYFTKITGKQLRRNLFLIKLQGYRKPFTGTASATCSNFQ